MFRRSGVTNIVGEGGRSLLGRSIEPEMVRECLERIQMRRLMGEIL